MSFIALESMRGSSFGQGQVLVGIHANGVLASLGGGSDGTVTGQTTATKDRIRAVVHHGFGGLGAPFGIGEGLIETHIAVVHNLNFGGGAIHAIGISGAGFVAFTKAPNGRNHIGTANGADDMALRHHRGESANEEASVVFREVQAGHVGDIVCCVFGVRPCLELIHADELDVRDRLAQRRQ